MKQVPVYLSAQAEEDLEGIADFIFERSGEPLIALGFVQRIRARCHKIGLAPAGGAPRPDFGENIRLVPFEKSAVILYRYEENEVEIVAVFYGGQDYAAAMTK
ncbi:type II toxin-antitoxin system RelE/ParE family toxin [Pseudosulfitobacter sp. DSM 107133]|uniref:type II toxin-antitoxin system RelE/ParE family toxin n=1 Tax=Pseudosulfitobacter sp. DSM 107133 TaxID=2883100 RepID=UPI000DF3E572|nr:type II toxin-antitoxin system RelE/ParE family toxin [Pseudosulfitobacter sp. DSM 107133]UOA30224.1 hypothetical protein DSM107133_04988 [Pseudosulfitobacter sp. DSM 107133]